MSRPSSPPEIRGPRKPRRWLRFSLRLLLIGVTLLCIGLGWWTHRAREQRRIVERIEQSKAKCLYDYMFLGDPGLRASLHFPDWLVGPLGPDFFYNVVMVDVYDREALQHIGGLRRVRKLRVRDREISDADLNVVGELTLLRTIDVEAREPSAVSDRTLALIGALPKIEDVQITGGRFTADGLAALAEAKTLRRVYLVGIEEDVDARAAEPFLSSGKVENFMMLRRNRMLVEGWWSDR